VKIAVVTARGSGGEEGGAERFYEALVASFCRLGHAAKEVVVRIDEPDFDQIKRNYLACYDLDLRDYDVVVSTKAPTWMIRHPRHICYLVHTIRVFYDMFDDVFPEPWDKLLDQRNLIHKLDSLGLSPPHCREVFSIGEEVAGRLMHWNRVPSKVLHPPLWRDEFLQGELGDYFFLPGRLHAWKRVDLVIRAFKELKGEVRLKIAGEGEEGAALRELAAGDPRIEFLGRVSDEALIDLYAGALAVPFAPKREDYGYVTLEAFASGKPVVTCNDSGEAAAIVQAAKGGYIAAPSVQALAEAMGALASDRENALAMGQSGHAWVQALSWEHVAQSLLAAAGSQPCSD